MIDMPFNHASELPEFPDTSFLFFLEDLEKKLIEKCVEDGYFIKECTGDESKKNTIDYFIEQRESAKNDLKYYKERIREISTRLETCEKTYTSYISHIRDSMVRKYYGKNFIGEEIFK